MQPTVQKRLHSVFFASLVGLAVAVSGSGDGLANPNPISMLDSGTTDGLARGGGFYFGAAMGRGSLDVDCGDCRERPRLSEGLSLTAHAGLRLNERLGVYGEYWLIRWSDRDGDWFDDADIHSITQQMISAGAQLWITRRLFLRASAGYGRHTTDIDYSKPENVLFNAAGDAAPVPEEPKEKDGSSSAMATSVGLGFELIRTRGFGLSAEFRYGRTRADNKDRDVSTTAASIGLTWF